MDVFSNLFVVKIVLCVWKDEKEAGVGVFLEKNISLSWLQFDQILEYKVAKFSKSCPKVNQSSFYSKVLFSKQPTLCGEKLQKLTNLVTLQS